MKIRRRRVGGVGVEMEELCPSGVSYKLRRSASPGFGIPLSRDLSRHTQSRIHSKNHSSFWYKNQQLSLERVPPTPLSVSSFLLLPLPQSLLCITCPVFNQPTMEQLTTSLAPSRASPPKAATPGTSSESAGSVTKRHVCK